MIWWNKRNDLFKVIIIIKESYGLPLISDTLNATQIHLQKPKGEIFVVDYYSFKSKGYNIF